MYLVKTSVDAILIQCCCAYGAFLYYIEKQAREFSKGLFTKIMENENFFYISMVSKCQITQPPPTTTRVTIAELT